MAPPPKQPVYLDNQATTPCDPRVLAAMLPWFTEQFGNPHSAEHAMGRQAEAAVEQAREQVAALIGAEPREVVFTSGATESNNIAIKGAARHAVAAGNPRRRVVTVATEHKCVLQSVADLRAEGFERVVLPVRPDGLLDPEMLARALAVPTLLVSVMAVNNEIGVVQDLAALAALARQQRALFHTDAAQGFGKIPLDVGAMGIDLLSISGHKIYGPKGVGALYVRRRPRVRLAPLFSGGGQERGLRAGTLPVPLIVGLGEAARLAQAGMAAEAQHLPASRSPAGPAGGVGARAGGERQHGGAHSGQPERYLPERRAPPTLMAMAPGCASPLARPAPRPSSSRPMCCAHWGCRTTPPRVPCGSGSDALPPGRHRLRGGGAGPCARESRACTDRGLTVPMPKMTFVERDGTRREVDAPLGLSVLEIAHKHSVDIEGACEGSLACSTCHVIIDPAWFARLAQPTEDEEDMLDLAFGLEKTSRLGCQIVMTEALDGLVVRLPAATRNVLGE